MTTPTPPSTSMGLAPDLPSTAPFLTTPHYTASFSLRPFTPLHVLLHLRAPLCTLPRAEFVAVLCAVRRLVAALREGGGWGFARVRRFGLVCDGGRTVGLVPMHGLAETWKPIVSYDHDLGPAADPGGAGEHSHLSTATTPHAPAPDLAALLHAIRARSHLLDAHISCDIPGPHPADNLFARLIRGELPAWKTHDARTHCAWLTPFPPAAARGATVVVPRAWATSDVLGIDEGVFEAYMGWTWDVARDVVRGLGRPLGEGSEDPRAPYQGPDERVVGFALFFEGFEIDWAHAKVYPVWTSRPWTSSDGSAPGSEETPADTADATAYYAERAAAQLAADERSPGAFYETYPGHLSTRPGPRVSAEREAELEELASRMRESLQRVG